jgi:hypothetical protein
MTNDHTPVSPATDADVEAVKAILASFFAAPTWNYALTLDPTNVERIVRLIARMEAAEQDARRYQWWCDTSHDIPARVFIRGKPAIDEFIDAAIHAPPKTQADRPKYKSPLEKQEANRWRNPD